MCGIAGIIGSPDLNFNKEKILKSILHRGPNSSGIYSKENVTLIHSRLSILDISDNGNQPMIDKENGVIIIYNGEIYNFKELRKELKTFNFFSNSDTEVILKLYIKYGIKLVNKLEGMFSIAIWDSKKKKLFLIRDRFGIKPIFYYYSGKYLAFSSEIKPIIDFGMKSELNEDTLFKYLKYGMLNTSDETFFKNIFSVPAGAILTFYKNKIHIKKYWKLQDNYSKKFSRLSEKDIEEKTFNLLESIFNEHLISDVPVGLCLSSGSDSRILLNFLEKFNLNSFESFTYGFNENKYDEIRKINNINPKIKKNSLILTSDDLIHDLEESINMFEEPIGGVGTLGLYKVMKLAKKKKIPVVLSGEGADEAFCGYKYYYYYYLWELYKNKKFDILNSEVSYLNKKFGKSTDLSENSLKKFIFSDLSFASAPDGTSLHDESFLTKKVLKFTNNNEFYNLKKKNHVSPLKDRIYKDLFYLKIPKLLWFADRASMSSGIECRVPFLDSRLIEHCFSLPVDLLIKKGISKNLLKKFLKDKFSYNNKKEKLYVATPQREWIKFNLRNKILDYIKDGFLIEKKLINYEDFKESYDKYSSSSKLGNSFKFWKILNAEILCRTFFN